MTNEATLIIQTGHALPFTVAEDAGIEKGAILKMTDLMTAELADGNEDVVAGIAASEKISGDGKTKLGVFREGIFKVYLSGSATVGDALITAAGEVTNYVKTAGLNGEDIIGIALETGADGETILMELKPMTINVA